MLVKEKNKVKNYLITVTDEEIKKLKVKNVNFLFPLKDLTVGFLKTYDIFDIDLNEAFIYVNRILDKEGMEKLEKILGNIPQNIKGICFTDLGVINLVKRLKLNLLLIYMQSHNTTNYLSINYYLEDVDSVLISTDITKEEIKNILDKAHKPLVVPFFMLGEAMYSRRQLLTNFTNKFNLEYQNEVMLHEPISENDFWATENKYGTVLYKKEFIDYRSLSHDNILYYYINSKGLSLRELENVIKGEKINFSNKGFLEQKTYYRLKEENNE